MSSRKLPRRACLMYSIFTSTLAGTIPSVPVVVIRPLFELGEWGIQTAPPVVPAIRGLRWMLRPVFCAPPLRCSAFFSFPFPSLTTESPGTSGSTALVSCSCSLNDQDICSFFPIYFL